MAAGEAWTARVPRSPKRWDISGEEREELGVINRRRAFGKPKPRRSMGLPYMPISWGVLGGQCRHIWHTWSVWEMIGL